MKPLPARVVRPVLPHLSLSPRGPRPVIPRHPHAVVDYRDLVSDPAASDRASLRRARDSHDAAPIRETLLLAEGKRARAPQDAHHSYSLEEFGLEADEIGASSRISSSASDCGRAPASEVRRHATRLRILRRRDPDDATNDAAVQSELRAAWDDMLGQALSRAGRHRSAGADAAPPRAIATSPRAIAI